MLFKKKQKNALYRVTYHEVDTTEQIVKVLDCLSIVYLDADWAFVIDKIEAVN